jgi:hypothetical protein
MDATHTSGEDTESHRLPTQGASCHIETASRGAPWLTASFVTTMNSWLLALSETVLHCSWRSALAWVCACACAQVRVQALATSAPPDKAGSSDKGLHQRRTSCEVMKVACSSLLRIPAIVVTRNPLHRFPSSHTDQLPRPCDSQAIPHACERRQRLATVTAITGP